jgi:adenylate cyclase
MDEKDAGKLLGVEEKASKKGWIWAAAAAVVFAIVGLGIWQFYPRRPSVEPASEAKMAYPLPDKPSIAVLPFDNMSGDPEQEYFSDGLSEEIITALSKSTEIFVIARNSSFTYKNKPVKVQQVAEDLGVRYVLEGSVRKDTERVRITAQLIDALKGIHLWAERYDRDLKDIFAIQDDITKQIIAALHVKLTIGEDARIIARSTNSLEAYLKYLQAREYHFRFTKEDNLNSRRLLEEVISIDPEYGTAYALLGATHILDVFLQATDSPKRSIGEATELYRKAIALGAHAQQLLGFVYSMEGQHEKAIAECRRAVELDPNSANARTFYGHVLNKAGRFQEAVLELEQSLRLDPVSSSFSLRVLGITYCNVGRYEDGIAFSKKAIQKAPNDLIAYLGLTYAYSAAGRQEEAQKAAAELLRINPKFFLQSYEKRAAYKNQADTDRMIAALRKAGLPYTPPLPLPDKPSIAVLAFDNLSGDPEQEYFSDGISEEIISALAKTDQLFVIARNSSFTYKGKPVNVKQVSRELGVRYVLEGSVRKSEDRVRITAQLIDATTGHHLWSERYDRELKDIFEVQDEITMKIITALQVELTEGEQMRIWAKRYKRLDVLLKAMELASLWEKGTEESIMRAGQVAQEVVDMAPELSIGYRQLGWYYYFLAFMGRSPQENLEKAYGFALKAISLDESDGLSYGLLGNVYSWMRQHEKAIAAGKRAIELDPNGANVHMYLGWTLNFAGRPDEAIEYLNKAIRLNPYPTLSYPEGMGRSYLLKGNYEKAITEFKKALQLAPMSPPVHMYLAVTYSLLGREEEARASAEKTLELAPFMSVSFVAKIAPYKNQADLELILDAMRKAGFPEGS